MGDMDQFRTFLIETFGSLDKAFQHLDFFKHGRVSCVEFQEVLHGQWGYCSLHDARNLFFALSEDGILQRKNLLNLEAQMALRVALGWNQESLNATKGSRRSSSSSRCVAHAGDTSVQESPSTPKGAKTSASSNRGLAHAGDTSVQESLSTPKGARTSASSNRRVAHAGDTSVQKSLSTPKGAKTSASSNRGLAHAGDTSVQESSSTPNCARTSASSACSAEDEMDVLLKEPSSAPEGGRVSLSPGRRAKNAGVTSVQESLSTSKPSRLRLPSGCCVMDEGVTLIHKWLSTPKGAVQNGSPKDQAHDECDRLSDSIFYLSDSCGDSTQRFSLVESSLHEASDTASPHPCSRHASFSSNLSPTHGEQHSPTRRRLPPMSSIHPRGARSASSGSDDLVVERGPTRRELDSDSGQRLPLSPTSRQTLVTLLGELDDDESVPPRLPAPPWPVALSGARQQAHSSPGHQKTHRHAAPIDGLEQINITPRTPSSSSTSPVHRDVSPNARVANNASTASRPSSRLLFTAPVTCSLSPEERVTGKARHAGVLENSPSGSPSSPWRLSSVSYSDIADLPGEQQSPSTAAIAFSVHQPRVLSGSRISGSSLGNEERKDAGQSADFPDHSRVEERGTPLSATNSDGQCDSGIHLPDEAHNEQHAIPMSVNDRSAYDDDSPPRRATIDVASPTLPPAPRVFRGRSVEDDRSPKPPALSRSRSATAPSASFAASTIFEHDNGRGQRSRSVAGSETRQLRGKSCVDMTEFQSSEPRNVGLPPGCGMADLIAEATEYAKELMVEVRKRKRQVELLELSLAEQTSRHQDEISQLIIHQEQQMSCALHHFQWDLKSQHVT